jgi:predicted TIM-barrel fold metal-dependent hydrolase
MSPKIVERIAVIDADTHISEPVDLWTARMSESKWGDMIPRVRFDPAIQEDRWYVAGEPFFPVGAAAVAGWGEPAPSHPPTMDQADPACYVAADRLKRMDEFGIHAQVIYPNLTLFATKLLLATDEPEFFFECVTTYNDFLVEWCAESPERLIPIMSLPFWDVDLSVREMQRAAAMGHKGLLMTNQPEAFGYPLVTDEHWNPLWETAQDLGLPVNFHVGHGDPDQILSGAEVNNGAQAAFTKAVVTTFLDNANAVLDIILSGMCHRYPKLDFVSVESGVGWMPFTLAAMDWQWQNTGGREEHPEMDLLPSEYFRRQVYGCFWFEEETAISAIQQIGSRNILYETDFPHPTSMSPGPNTTARVPKDQIEVALSGLAEPDLENVLHNNAARVYRLGS